MHPTVPSRTRATRRPPSIGIGGRHASERVVAFAGMRTLLPNASMTSSTRAILFA